MWLRDGYDDGAGGGELPRILGLRRRVSIKVRVRGGIGPGRVRGDVARGIGPGRVGGDGRRNAPRRRSREDDEPTLIPLELPVGGDGHLGGDEGVAQRRVQDGRRRRVARGRLAPKVGIGRRCEAEQVHVLRKQGIFGTIERRKGRAVWRHCVRAPVSSALLVLSECLLCCFATEECAGPAACAAKVAPRDDIWYMGPCALSPPENAD